MINYETLLSSYDDKLTLMQWLKKVEEALKGASAVSFKVNKRGDATLTFSVVFEDGSELETSPIILQQGESVQGATIRNGHLILTLTNGDELDAGNLGAVSGFSIDASQHLVVTYQNGATQDLGAIFSGNVSIDGTLNANVVDGTKVTGDEIVEKMSGYAMAKLNTEYFNTLNITYAGAVKNGNKVTFAVAGIMNIKETLLNIGGRNFIKITIPISVGSKLYPTTLANIDYVLSFGIINLAVNQNTYVQGHYRVTKASNSEIGLWILTNGMSINTDYYFRWEETFLLSDNLIGD